MEENIGYSSTKRTYNKIAKDWAAKHFDSKKMDGEVKIFLNYIKQNGRILDVGCGPGKYTSKFISKGYKATGVDFSTGMIKEAKKRVPGGDFRVMDMKDLDFKKNLFDGVWCFAALLHIEKKDALKVLKGFRRVAKTGSVLALSVKQGEGEGIENSEDKFKGQRFFSYYNKSGLSELVKKAGFRVIRTKLNHFTDEWIVLFAKAVE